MADPVVHITNGIPDLGTGNITTLGQTLIDGANVVLGATTDVAVAAGAAGTINAHLRALSRDLVNGISLAAGANTIGTVLQGSPPWSANITQFGGNPVITGTGIGGAGIPRVTVSSDSSLAATQSGTWNIGSITTLPLPPGASTAAKQPSLGTAGVPSADVITVQGVGGMTALKVDGTGGSFPITAASPLAVTQSGTWDIRNVSGTVSLPTGAATSARQILGGSAGTPSAEVGTIQGISGMVAVKTTISGNSGANLDFAGQNAATTTNAVLTGGQFNTTPTTITSGNFSPLQLDSSGNLRVNIMAGAGSGGTASTVGGATPSQGTLALGAVTTAAPSYTTATANSLSLNTSGGLRVDGSGVTQPVSGTFWQATQPVSGTFWQATQPVSGTVTANQGGSWTTLGQGAVTTAAPAYTTGTNNNLSLNTSGGLRVDGSGVTQPVSGTFWQATQPVSIAAAVTVQQATASNLNATVAGTVTANLGTIAGVATAANQPTNSAQGASTAAQTGNLAFGAVTTAAPTYTTAQSNPLSLTTVGALRVDGSGVTQPVSGTVTANQGGTWTVQPGNTANTTPWLVTPKGFQDSGGTDITDTTNHALKVNIVAGAGSGGTSSNFSATFPTAGTAAGAEYLSSPPTLTTGQMVALQTDVNGNLKVNIQAGGGSGGTASSFGAAFPATGTAIGATDGTNMKALSVDGAGNLKVTNNPVIWNTTGAAWNSSTTLNTTQTLYDGAQGIYDGLSGQLTQTTTLTAGAVTFEESFDGNVTFKAIPAARLIDPSTGLQLTNPYTLVASTNQAFEIIFAAPSQIRLRLSTVITGTGSVTPAWSKSQASHANQVVGTGTFPMQIYQGGNYATVSAAGALKVDGSAVTQPVSGTFWQATQPVSGTFWQATQPVSGTVTVTQATAANLNATVSGTVTANQGGTWNITNISGTVSLPTGAATSANQPTNASLGSTTSGQTGHLSLGAVTTAAPSYTTAQSNALSLTTAGALRVDGSGVTQPVSGTFWQATQPVSGTVTANQGGTWTVQPGNTANTTAWLVTGTGGTFPITAASLPLPSGAATAANQTNVQGVIGNATAPTSMIVTGGVFNTTKPTLTTGQSAAIQVNSSGIQLVDGSAVTQPVSGTFWQATQPVSIAAAVTVAQATAANLNATVTGTITANQGGTWTVQPGNTANTTAWLVTGTGGTFPVTQATSSNLKAQVDPLTAASWGIGSSTQNSASVANGVMALAQFNTTPTAITSGNMSPLQMDTNGNLLVNVKAGGGAGGTSSTFAAAFPGTGTAAGAQYLSTQPTLTSGQMNALLLDVNGNLRVSTPATVSAGTTWNSGTALNATQSIANNPSILGQVTVGTTITAGALTFEESYDNGTTWLSVPAGRLINPSTGAQIANPYTLVASTNLQFQIVSTGTTQMRVRLSTAITGTGTAAFSFTSSPLLNEVQCYQNNNANLKVQPNFLDSGGTNMTDPGYNALRVLIAQSNATIAVGGDMGLGVGPDGQSPLKMGGIARTTMPQAFSDQQRVGAVFDKQGKLIVNSTIRELRKVQKTSITSTTETTVATAIAATFLDVYAIVITNKSATSTFVDFRDSTGGTVRLTLAAPANDTRGFTLPGGDAIPQATVNNNWTAQAAAAVTSLEITVLFNQCT